MDSTAYLSSTNEATIVTLTIYVYIILSTIIEFHVSEKKWSYLSNRSVDIKKTKESIILYANYIEMLLYEDISWPQNVFVTLNKTEDNT